MVLREFTLKTSEFLLCCGCRQVTSGCMHQQQRLFLLISAEPQLEHRQHVAQAGAVMPIPHLAAAADGLKATALEKDDGR